MDTPTSRPRVVGTTLRPRSTDTTPSPSEIRSSLTPRANALTYSMAPPFGYVKVALYEAWSGLTKFATISSNDACGKNLPIASTSSVFRSHAYSFSLYGIKNISAMPRPNFAYNIS